MSDTQTVNPSAIDRQAPRRRPSRSPAGWQQWRHLSFIHWPIDAALIRQAVPSSLELDLWDGAAYIGIVPFSMQCVQPFSWWPSACGFRFLETNVRTYVHCQGQPGVYFLSLDAASRLAVRTARTLWGLPYYHAHMNLQDANGQVRYQSWRSRGGAELETTVTVGDPLPPFEEGTPGFFFLERYYLFVERNRTLYRGQVHHVPYPAHAAHCESVSESLLEAGHLPSVTEPPHFVHYSPGVDVEIFSLERV